MNFPEKLKVIRKLKGLTQSEFASILGISRSNLANLEKGSVKPTQIFINCVSLTYNVDKAWLIDNNNDNIPNFGNPNDIASLIVEKYQLLDDKHKKFVENQILQLLELQNSYLKSK